MSLDHWFQTVAVDQVNKSTRSPNYDVDSTGLLPNPLPSPLKASSLNKDEEFGVTTAEPTKWELFLALKLWVVIEETPIMEDEQEEAIEEEGLGGGVDKGGWKKKKKNEWCFRLPPC
ncbi:hypothetical protein Leryth_004272 [Lithospermum erythrorhizon]|nr:hypothetical protein Leryth_004272 [Lithospermum erythrorhizon]